MPITVEQFVSIVPITEADINNEIDEHQEDGYMLTSITLSGTDVILLFTRTVAA